MTKTLNQLAALNEAPADNDEFIVGDSSAMEDKRVRYADMVGGLRDDIENRVVAGASEIDVSGGSNITLTDQQSRHLVIDLTGGLTSDISIIVPDDVRLYMVANGSTGSFEITVRTASGSGVSVPQGESMFLRCDGANVVEVMPQSSAGVTIGGYVFVQDNLEGAEPPDQETHIKLTAGEAGAGEYNEGKLSSESVSGSSPLVTATAVISDEDSPMAFQTIHLINTEYRYLAPGRNPGRASDDQMQQIVGNTDFHDGIVGVGDTSSPSGAFSKGQVSMGYRVQGLSGGARSLRFDSADSPTARTGNHTNVKRLEVTAYMRIK